MVANMPKPINSSYDEDAVEKVIADAIGDFYESLIDGIGALDLDTVLKRKNPYLFRAKSPQSASDVIESVLDAYVSSSEETIFGNLFFEPLARAASGGRKSISEGVDLELESGSIRHAIAVKSGTAVFNADSKKKQKQNFERAAALARQGGMALSPAIGYAYGAKEQSSRGFALELAGQDFWEYVTGDPDFYKKIVLFMRDEPEVYAKRFAAVKARTLNKLVKEFSDRYVDAEGEIDWESILEFNSGSIARKKAAAFADLKARCLKEVSANPSSTKKALKAALSCSNPQLDKALDELVDEGRLRKGRNGKKAGWTIL